MHREKACDTAIRHEDSFTKQMHKPKAGNMWTSTVHKASMGSQTKLRMAACV